MARTSHIVRAFIGAPTLATRLRACRAWRVSPMQGADYLGPYDLTGTFPVVVRLTTPSGDPLAQPVTVDNDGWQTVPTGPDWYIESVARGPVEGRIGYLYGATIQDAQPISYLVECVDDVSETGQVNTRTDDLPLPPAVEFTKRITGPVTLNAGGTLAGCVGPIWANRLAVVLFGPTPAPPALQFIDLSLSATFSVPAPASLPAELLLGFPPGAVTPGRVLAGSTPLPPGRTAALVNVQAWTFTLAQYLDVCFRWSR